MAIFAFIIGKYRPDMTKKKTLWVLAREAVGIFEFFPNN